MRVWVVAPHALVPTLNSRDWNRVLPPMSEVPMPERAWMVRDFAHWESGLPEAWRTFYPAEQQRGSQLIVKRRA